MELLWHYYTCVLCISHSYACGEGGGGWATMGVLMTDISTPLGFWALLSNIDCLEKSDIEFCNKSGSGPGGMWMILTFNLDPWWGILTKCFFCVRIPRVCPSWGITLTGAILPGLELQTQFYNHFHYFQLPDAYYMLTYHVHTRTQRF